VADTNGTPGSLPVALGVTNVLPVATVTQLTGGPMPDTTQDDVRVESPAPAEEALVEESLVEEVSIDGMCGVY
jgi:mycofactocin precursor